MGNGITISAAPETDINEYFQQTWIAYSMVQKSDAFK